jgi:hypothetical protein
LEKHVAVDVMMKGGESVRLEDVLRLRQFTFQELLLLAELTNFEVGGYCTLRVHLHVTLFGLGSST